MSGMSGRPLGRSRRAFLGRVASAGTVLGAGIGVFDAGHRTRFEVLAFLHKFFHAL